MQLGCSRPSRTNAVPLRRAARRSAHRDTSVSFDLISGPGNDAIGRSFLIAPAILIPFGIVMLQTRLVPRSYGYTALMFRAASQALGLLGLFSQIAFADINPAVLGLENLWLIALAITLCGPHANSPPPPEL